MNTTNQFKTNPFKTPEGYFDNFEQKLFAKIEGQKKQRNIKLLWISSSAAAAVIIGFLLINTIKQPPDNYLSRNEIEVYFENHNSPFDDEIIYNGLYKEKTHSEKQLKQEAIYNYLMEDNGSNDLFLE